MDGDHTVSREELQVAVEKNCKRSISLAEIEGILSKADLNQSGALDFGEFLEQIFNIEQINRKSKIEKCLKSCKTFMATVNKAAKKYDELIEAFQVIQTKNQMSTSQSYPAIFKNIQKY